MHKSIESKRMEVPVEIPQLRSVLELDNKKESSTLKVLVLMTWKEWACTCYISF